MANAKKDIKKEQKIIDKTQKQSQKPKKTEGKLKLKYVIGIIFVVIIIGIAIFASSFFAQNSPVGFDTFKNNFNSAPRVDIMIAGSNGTVLSSTVGCATAVIQQIIASKANHRDSSTIDFTIINQTSCIRTTGLGSRTTPNYTTVSLQSCLDLAKKEPTIFINYSTTNKTVINPSYLYIAGTKTFLLQCGVASQIS